jgi:hypothetical protein
LDHRGLVLKNFLLLVLLLDRAVAPRQTSEGAQGTTDAAGSGSGIGNFGSKAPRGAPPLFNLRAAHKSSAEARVIL